MIMQSQSITALPLALALALAPTVAARGSADEYISGIYTGLPTYSNITTAMFNLADLRHYAPEKADGNTPLVLLQVILLLCSTFAYIMFSIFFAFFCVSAARSLRWSRKFVPFFVFVGFFGLRLCYLPLVYLLTPLEDLPSGAPRSFYSAIIGLGHIYVAWIAFPILFGIYGALRGGLSRRPLTTVEKHVEAQKQLEMHLDTNKLPQMTVVMTIGNEDPDSVVRSVRSVLNSAYSAKHLLVYLYFDNDEQTGLYMQVMRMLRKNAEHPAAGYATRHCIHHDQVELIIQRCTRSSKLNLQRRAVNEIRENFKDSDKTTLVMFMDADVVLEEGTMMEFVQEMLGRNDVIGLSGFIVGACSQKTGFLTYLHDCQYALSLLFNRSVEAAFGSVPVIPSGLTVFRLRELAIAVKAYTAERDPGDGSYTGRIVANSENFCTGQDRLMTHVLTRQTRTYTVALCPDARAKNATPSTLSAFYRQRCNWLLGNLANDIYFMTDIRMWLSSPVVVLYKLIEYISTVSSLAIQLLFLQMTVCSKTSDGQGVAIAMPLLAYWLVILSYAILFRRYKTLLSFPFMIILLPWIDFVILMYGVFTWDGLSASRMIKANKYDIESGQTLSSVPVDGSRPAASASVQSSATERQRPATSGFPAPPPPTPSGSPDRARPVSHVESHSSPMSSPSMTQRTHLAPTHATSLSRLVKSSSATNLQNSMDGDFDAKEPQPFFASSSTHSLHTHSTLEKKGSLSNLSGLANGTAFGGASSGGGGMRRSQSGSLGPLQQKEHMLKYGKGSGTNSPNASGTNTPKKSGVINSGRPVHLH
ncbi:hypothetical protein BC831DRAFT_293747 [Entophlyctis helioformis]|nr:hypothetical protein BC831DRAFT_293747 [Entophlyctis helioformis]